MDSWAVTKLDVLSGMKKLKICIGYEDDARVYKHFPSDSRILSGIRPIYQEFSGWEEPLSGMRQWNDLPAAARDYLEFIEQFTATPISILSVGPAREDTIVK